MNFDWEFDVLRSTNTAETLKWWRHSHSLLYTHTADGNEFHNIVQITTFAVCATLVLYTYKLWRKHTDSDMSMTHFPRNKLLATFNRVSQHIQSLRYDIDNCWLELHIPVKLMSNKQREYICITPRMTEEKPATNLCT